ATWIASGGAEQATPPGGHPLVALNATVSRRCAAVPGGSPRCRASRTRPPLRGASPDADCRECPEGQSARGSCLSWRGEVEGSVEGEVELCHAAGGRSLRVPCRACVGGSAVGRSGGGAGPRTGCARRLGG